MQLKTAALLAAVAIGVSYAGVSHQVQAQPPAKSPPASSNADGPRPPPPPPLVVPDIRKVNPPVLCVNCDQPFDTDTHKKLLEALVKNPYIAELRRALYYQDSVHQFESKAHFDNCDFDSASNYIVEPLDDAGKHVEAALKAKTSGDKETQQLAALQAFFSLGQALHGTQDFYAHTNYVELLTPKVTRVTDIPVLVPSRSAGRARIKELQQEGLISGFVFWGVPQNCPSGTISHSKLAKDAADTASGKVVVPHLQNISQYKIAAFLAREASLKVLSDAFKKWPLLKEMNGEAVAVDVLIDQRMVNPQ